MHKTDQLCINVTTWWKDLSVDSLMLKKANSGDSVRRRTWKSLPSTRIHVLLTNWSRKKVICHSLSCVDVSEILSSSDKKLQNNLVLSIFMTVLKVPISCSSTSEGMKNSSRSKWTSWSWEIWYGCRTLTCNIFLYFLFQILSQWKLKW